MHDKHHRDLRMYLNDVIGVERDIIDALEGQLEDERVTAHPELTIVLRKMREDAVKRIDCLKLVSEQEGGRVGATVKEAAMAVGGTLAGFYGKLREHPVSRMVRDDLIALHVTETSYAMLYTLALGVGHSETADIAFNGVQSAPPLILELTDLLPGIVLTELSAEAPLADPDAHTTVLAAVRDAWRKS